jgi:hypothetical protein
MRKQCFFKSRRNIMHEKNCSAVGVFRNHEDAEAAVKEFQQSGFAMKKLSVVGKDYHTEVNVIGYYNTGDRMATWGKFGLFWGATGKLPELAA